MEKSFWDSVQAISENQRKLPQQIRALADVPRTSVHPERLASRNAQPVLDAETREGSASE
jgi:hypothetical protein